jgi:tetratricopeptide (TPR) repeat protein
MQTDLEVRLRRVRSSSDVDELLDLGCDLADAGRQADAEWCFRRAAELGEPVAWFNLGNALAGQDRLEEAVAAYEQAIAGGEPDAWRNLGRVLETLGDLAGAMRAYRGAADAGDLQGGLQLAFLLQEQGEPEQAAEVARMLALAGDDEAAAVLACWRWCATHDVSLEADLRAGADRFPAARGDLAVLLRETGRADEARFVLERGAKRGDVESWLPLGNLYCEELGDVEAAEEAYRSGISAGDIYCHHNLGILLANRGDLEGAVEQFGLGAAAGDGMAASALREFDRG